jgi:hypothetical protein
MRTKTLIIALILALSAILSGATKLDFQTGRLLEVTMDEQLDEGTTYRRPLYSVQIDDLVYTARGRLIWWHSGDVGKGLIIGDTVHVAIEGGNLVFLKPDGKEFKARIVKRARMH